MTTKPKGHALHAPDPTKPISKLIAALAEVDAAIDALQDCAVSRGEAELLSGLADGLMKQAHMARLTADHLVAQFKKVQS